jgi:predicted transcriptional regulator
VKAQAAKNAELEMLVKSQAVMIPELETAYANLRHEKENVIASYRRLAGKHNAFTEKTGQEKTKLAGAHAVELAKIHDDLDLGTRSYTKCCHTVCRKLHELHKTVASSFDEVKAQCLPFPGKGGGND